MLKSELLAAIQREIQSHNFSHFVDDPPAFAEGGKGLFVPWVSKMSCANPNDSQFLDHLANDAMPTLLARLSHQSDVR